MESDKIMQNTMNWELNEKISLSSGSNMGIEIRSDIGKGIISNERPKIDVQHFKNHKNPTTNRIPSILPRSQEISRNLTKQSLDLLNVSGFSYPENQEKMQSSRFTDADIFQRNNRIDEHVIKSDSKYEIGVPGECTMLRKKKKQQLRQSCNRDSIKSTKISSKNNRNDLTGSRRRWDLSKHKINESNDSITTRLELIHELNQKILANYERFQQKSKRPYGKYVSALDLQENSKGSTKNQDLDDGNVVRLPSMDFKDLFPNDKHIYSEITSKRKDKSVLSYQNDKHFMRHVEKNCSGNVDKLNGSKLDLVGFESIENNAKKNVSRALKKLSSGSLPQSQKTSSCYSNDNFSLLSKPEFQFDTKIFENREEKDDLTRRKLYSTCSPVLEHKRNDDFHRIIENREEKDDLAKRKLLSTCSPVLHDKKNDDFHRIIENREEKDDLSRRKLHSTCSHKKNDDFDRIIENREEKDDFSSRKRHSTCSHKKNDDFHRIIENREEKDDLSKRKLHSTCSPVLHDTKNDDFHRINENREEKDDSPSRKLHSTCSSILRDKKNDDFDRINENREEKDDFPSRKLHSTCSHKKNDDFHRIIENREEKDDLSKRKLHSTCSPVLHHKKNDDFRRIIENQEEKDDLPSRKLNSTCSSVVFTVHHKKNGDFHSDHSHKDDLRKLNKNSDDSINSRLHPESQTHFCNRSSRETEDDESKTSHKSIKTNLKIDNDFEAASKVTESEDKSLSLSESESRIDEKTKLLELRRQEILEKEILDNLNETIERFDNEIENESNKMMATETNEVETYDNDDEDDDDSGESFSTDSIQSTSRTSKTRSTIPAEKTCLQQTFDSSWDSGVGIDIGSGNGWIRIHTGIESSLVFLTLDTTVKDVCRDMLLGEDSSLFIGYGGESGRRMAPHERPLEYQDEFLKQLGYEEITRRARLGVDPELRHLIAFHVGPTVPLPDLIGYSRSGNALVLKGLVFPQWKKRSLAVIGSRLFLYPSCPNSRPEWIELGGGGGAVCYAPSRLGKLVLRVTGFPRITNSQLQQHYQSRIDAHHQETRHLYLGFQHPWDRDLWRGWLKQAIQTSTCPTQLDLIKAGLSRIPESILAFPAIEEILLARNQLNNSHNNLSILERFPYLHTVRIECNQLKSVPEELLKLRTLTILDLSDNKIEQVPVEIVRLVNLKELILNRNVIKNLPDAVGKLVNLRIISLVGNLLTNLPVFLNMRALAIADVLLKADHGKNVKNEKNNQNNLHKVNLRNNQLKGSIILGNYGNLTHLDVSENNIEKLDVSALQELQSARCARNALTELTLCGRSLVSLIAGNNKLKKLTIEPVPTNLEHLDVSYNSLDALPEWIPDLPELRALFASHNALTALPDRLLSQPSKLEVLHLPHNRLQALPPPRKPLNIAHLTLQGNALTALPTSFFVNTERMKVLNLSNNRLSELPYNDESCNNRPTSHTLEKLYLTGNCLTDTALDALAKLPALRVLHLAYNVLDTLPESCIASWPDLEELVISGNRLQYLPDNVANLQHLRVLRVHSNRLLTCPTFNKTASLMVLDLAHNQLDRINLTTLVPPQLQFLDISCNSRLHVDPRQFQVYRSLRPVSLIDVSGQNRSSLPSHPHQQDIAKPDKGPEQPWRLGFSETAGGREKLFVSQLRMPSFCNTEGLFGIFDGGTNQEAPDGLQEMVPRLLLEERTVRETSKDYLKYTLLSIYRELKQNGQKYGVDATLIHMTRLTSPQGYPRTSKRYSLKVVSSGEARSVLCRAAGPLVLAPPKKNQIGNTTVFPLVVPDPRIEEVTIESDDEFVIIANRKLWEVLSVEEAVREARAEASPVLAAKRLQDLAQAYGAEDNLSIVVIRFTASGTGADLDQLMRELRHAVNKNRNQSDGNCMCPCCVPPNPHKPPAPCCCHVNDGYYLNGVLKNIANRPGQSHNSSGRFFKNRRNTENSSPPYNDDRSSPSGQSDQTSESTFKTRDASGRGWSAGSAVSRAATKNRQSVIMQENGIRKQLGPGSYRVAAHEDAESERSGALSEEQFRCWEYMLEQNTQLLFDKELDTLARVPLRRGQSRSTPQLAGNLPFLSKRFGSARSFNPALPRAPMIRFGSGRRFLNGGPNAAYFGSLQRLMPYNLEYDFAVIQERGGMDSLEQDASRMQQYWGVATTEL